MYVTKKGSKVEHSIFVMPWSFKRSPPPTLPLLGNFSSEHKNLMGIHGQGLGTQESKARNWRPWGPAYYLAIWEGSSEAGVAFGACSAKRLGLSYVVVAALKWPKGQHSAHQTHWADLLEQKISSDVSPGTTVCS